MSDTYYEQLRQAIGQLEGLVGVELLKGIEQVIDLASKNSDGDTVAEFAQHLITVGSREGRLDYEMRGFGQLRDLYQRDGRFSDLKAQLLWYYKWLAERLPEFVDISQQQIRDLLDQMDAFYKAHNAGERPVHEMRCRAAAFMGHEEEAHRHAELWQSTPSCDSDDCPACETHARVQYLLHCGKAEEAIEAAGPILQGEQSCDEVPATTFSRLLLPLAFTGQAELAFGMSRFVRPMVCKTPALLGHLADNVVLHSFPSVTPEGRRLNWIMLARVTQAHNDFIRFCVWRAAWVHFARLAMGGTTQITFGARTEFAGEKWRTEEAAGLYQARAQQLAEGFDRRNCTDRFTQRMASIQKLIDLRVEP